MEDSSGKGGDRWSFDRLTDLPLRGHDPRPGWARMFEPWDHQWYAPFGHDGHGGSLGREYTINDEGEVSLAFGLRLPGTTSVHGLAHSSTPAPSMVGSPGGLQIELVWDSSVAHAPKSFRPAVIAAARYYATTYSDDEMIRIDVGYGEVHGLRMGRGDLGESQSNGYMVSYAALTAAMQSDGGPLSLAGNAPGAAKFFVTSAEAKALGLIDGHGGGVDGYIGLSSSLPLSYAPGGPPSGSRQYDATAIAEHEIGEVMGRIGLEGSQGTYTPLDLFIFAGPGQLELSANGGYFSVDNGMTNLGTFDDAAANGGDIADWASSAPPAGSTYDAYDAFTFPGHHGVVTPVDVVLNEALGYEPKSGAVA